jgi:ABC-type transport system involved in multi-copper enzyme maturation permease subunit
VTAALTWARLSYRQQRWELILIVIGVAAVAGAMLWFSQQLTGMVAASPDCLPPAIDELPASCSQLLQAYYETSAFADNLLLLSFAAPFGMGVLLGAPLVAREIDSGTAQLAWSLGRSRIGWLLRRIAFIALAAVVLLAVLAYTSELLAAAMAPDRNLSQDFTWFGRRGWLIVARGLGALMLGMAVGALIGRVLPAILAAGLVIAVAFTGISLAMDEWHHREAVPQRFMAAPNEPGDFDMGALAVDYGIQLRDGELVSYGDLYRRGVTTQISDEQGRSYASEADYEAGNFIGYDVQMVIPGERYPELVAREGAVVGALALLALGLTAAIVRRRRPL